MNRVNQIHIKLVDNNTNNIEILNISFLKRYTRMINHGLDITHLDPYQHGLHPSVRCTTYTTYGESLLDILH